MEKAVTFMAVFASQSSETWLPRLSSEAQCPLRCSGIGSMLYSEQEVGMDCLTHPPHCVSVPVSLPKPTVCKSDPST